MKEIKFRAWSNKENRFLDGNDNTPNYLGVEPVEPYGNFVPMYMGILESGVYGMGAELEFNLYTGLKDKNDIEIYEGDIMEGENFIGTVVWDKEYALFSVPGYKTYSTKSISGAISGGLEVIGNIYKNKELLNETI